MRSFPTRLIKPVLAGCKLDPLLAKAKPISNGGSTSGITYLRKGRKNSTREMDVRERSEAM